MKTTHKYYLLTALAACVLSACGKKEDVQSPLTPPPVSNATNQPAPPATASPAFEKLKGKWLRPDGGYVVEVRSVEAGGKLDATYSNPKPIHVAKAQATQEGAVTKVLIELRDVNYPGSTYNLVYDPASDQLTGIYYQALLQEKFEVIFVRMK
jgi:hypothetical protein